MWYWLSLSIMFHMLTNLFSTNGFQHFSFPLTQHNATSESNHQFAESIETRPFKATNTSFKILLNKSHPNNSKRGMDNFFKGATLVLAHKNSLLYPKLFRLEYKPYRNKPGRKHIKNSLLYPKLFPFEYKPYRNIPGRNCHKNHVMKLIRLFLWVAQMQTAILSIFQFALNLPKSHSKLIRFNWIYFHPMNTDFCTATVISF